LVQLSCGANDSTHCNRCGAIAGSGEPTVAVPPRQVVRIHRKRRRIGARKWQTETVYAVTDLAAHQADAAEIAAWAHGHWIIENTVHRAKDVTFAEDASQIRRHCTLSVMTALRDLAPATLHRAGWTNIASARRAHSHPEVVLALHGIP
jgi:predicted transposase YbfD/YdcC